MHTMGCLSAQSSIHPCIFQLTSLRKAIQPVANAAAARPFHQRLVPVRYLCIASLQWRSKRPAPSAPSICRTRKSNGKSRGTVILTILGTAFDFVQSCLADFGTWHLGTALLSVQFDLLGTLGTLKAWKKSTPKLRLQVSWSVKSRRKSHLSTHVQQNLRGQCLTETRVTVLRMSRNHSLVCFKVLDTACYT